MPIKWSALQVSEVTDRIEAEVEKLREPLENIRGIIDEASTIPNLPDYIKQRFVSILSETERIIDGVHPWNQEPYPGVLQRAVESIRRDLPQDTLQAEQTKRQYGSQQTLV